MLITVKYEIDLENVHVGDLIQGLEIVDISGDSIICIDPSLDSSGEPYYYSKKTGRCMSDTELDELETSSFNLVNRSEGGFNQEEISRLLGLLRNICGPGIYIEIKLEVIDENGNYDYCDIISGGLKFDFSHNDHHGGYLVISIPKDYPFLKDGGLIWVPYEKVAFSLFQDECTSSKKVEIVIKKLNPFSNKVKQLLDYVKHEYYC